MEQKIPTVIIIGAGLGGLSLYYALMKNKDKKEFNVKIFERDSGPQDRWQGFHISLNNEGVGSLLNCIPSSIASTLSEAMPDLVPGLEKNGIILGDHTGNILFNPPHKQIRDIHELAVTPAFITGHRDKLRTVLARNVPVQWGKKFVRYEETKEGVWVFFEDGTREFCDILVGSDGINSPVRKQKIPELQIFEYGVTQIDAELAVPKNLLDRLLKLCGNTFVQRFLGLNGDAMWIFFRLIPIEHEQEKDYEPHYEASLSISYPAELDEIDLKVDDNDPISLIRYVKKMIRKLRPECELTDIFLEMWDLASGVNPKFPFKTYNHVQRRKLRDIDPLSVNAWKSSRVTLLGDAVHAMNPILGLGANNAFKDAEILSQALLNYSPENYISCIKGYENEMIKRSSAAVLKGRSAALKQASPVGGYFGLMFRNYGLRIVNFLTNFFGRDVIFTK